MAKCFAYDFVCIIYNYPVFALASHVCFASLAFVKRILQTHGQCSAMKIEQGNKNGALNPKLM